MEIFESYIKEVPIEHVDDKVLFNKQVLVLPNWKDNKNCLDCNKQNPTYISINNGVFICDECALIHINKLGNKLSYIKPNLFNKLDTYTSYNHDKEFNSLNEEWDDYLLMYILRGGNYRFKKLLDKYNISYSNIDKSNIMHFKYANDNIKKQYKLCNYENLNSDSEENEITLNKLKKVDITLKYMTKAASYYRELLKSEVNCYLPPNELPILLGSEIEEEYDINGNLAFQSMNKDDLKYYCVNSNTYIIYDNCNYTYDIKNNFKEIKKTIINYTNGLIIKARNSDIPNNIKNNSINVACKAIKTIGTFSNKILNSFYKYTNSFSRYSCSNYNFGNNYINELYYTNCNNNLSRINKGVLTNDKDTELDNDAYFLNNNTSYNSSIYDSDEYEIVPKTSNNKLSYIEVSSFIIVNETEFKKKQISNNINNNFINIKPIYSNLIK